MRKKLLPLLLCAALLVSLVACGNSTPTASTPNDTPSSSTEQQPTEQPSNEPEQPSEQPTEQPSEEPTEEPSEETAPSEEPTEEPTEQPSEQPTEEPTASGETTEGSESDVGSEETDEPETVPSTEPEEVVHTHSYNSYKSNNDGTHTVICTSTTGTCDANTYIENCTGNTCSKCGYTVPHNHKYSYTSNGDGTHTATCTSTTGSCTAKTYTENCSNGTCNKCGYTKPQEPVDIIPTGWNGIGVNTTIEWDFEDPLTNMPNTAAVIEKYGSGYSGGGNTFTAAGVGVANNLGNGIWIKGYQYSAIDPAAHETAIAMIKDLLDTESATALVNWLEELDRLHKKAYASVADDAKYEAAMAELKAYGNTLIKATSPVPFGNVTVEWDSSAGISLFIYNK